MARAICAWAINRGGKNSVRNLRYGPRTRLVKKDNEIKKRGGSRALKQPQLMMAIINEFGCIGTSQVFLIVFKEDL